jgi:hypothetical protein
MFFAGMTRKIHSGKPAHPAGKMYFMPICYKFLPKQHFKPSEKNGLRIDGLKD